MWGALLPSLLLPLVDVHVLSLLLSTVQCGVKSDWRWQECSGVYCGACYFTSARPVNSPFEWRDKRQDVFTTHSLTRCFSLYLSTSFLKVVPGCKVFERVCVCVWVHVVCCICVTLTMSVAYVNSSFMSLGSSCACYCQLCVHYAHRQTPVGTFDLLQGEKERRRKRGHRNSPRSIDLSIREAKRQWESAGREKERERELRVYQRCK